jgi:hypothetical protein
MRKKQHIISRKRRENKVKMDIKVLCFVIDKLRTMRNEKHSMNDEVGLMAYYRDIIAALVENTFL